MSQSGPSREEKLAAAHAEQAKLRAHTRAREREAAAEAFAELMAEALPPADAIAEEALKVLRAIALNVASEDKDRVAAAKAIREGVDAHKRFFDLFPSHQAAARWLVAETPRLLALAGVDGNDQAEAAALVAPKEKP